MALSSSWKPNGINFILMETKMNSNIIICIRKLIGARYYTNSSSIKSRSARDQDGHGTHVAAIAAGNPVQGASYNGLGLGTARGGAPNSRIAVYRVCDEYSCGGSDLLKAFDDAIADGVDIISLSIGSAIRKALFSIDPIAIGAFHAMENGILVVCSAGNDGAEERESVINVAPWILTVGATTIDRDFETNVLLGGNKVIKVLPSFQHILNKKRSKNITSSFSIYF